MKRGMLLLPLLVLLAGCGSAAPAAQQDFGDFDSPTIPIPGLGDAFTPHDIEVSYDWLLESPTATVTWSSAAVPLGGSWTLVYDYGVGDAEVVYCTASPCRFTLANRYYLSAEEYSAYLDEGAIVTVAAGDPNNSGTMQDSVGVPSIDVLTSPPINVSPTMDWTSGGSGPMFGLTWNTANEELFHRWMHVGVDYIPPFDAPTDETVECYSTCTFELTSFSSTRFPDDFVFSTMRVWMTDAVGETYQYDVDVPPGAPFGQPLAIEVAPPPAPPAAPAPPPAEPAPPAPAPPTAAPPVTTSPTSSPPVTPSPSASAPAPAPSAEAAAPTAGTRTPPPPSLNAGLLVVALVLVVVILGVALVVTLFVLRRRHSAVSA